MEMQSRLNILQQKTSLSANFKLLDSRKFKAAYAILSSYLNKQMSCHRPIIVHTIIVLFPLICMDQEPEMNPHTSRLFISECRSAFEFSLVSLSSVSTMVVADLPFVTVPCFVCHNTVMFAGDVFS